MNEQKTQPFKPRFPLFGKVIVGFVFIIVFMVLSSAFVILQLRGAFTTGREDLQVTERNNLYSIRLARVLGIQGDAIQSYVATRDTLAYELFLEKQNEFQVLLDTLNASTARVEIRSLLASIAEEHTQFDDIATKIFFDIGTDSDRVVTLSVPRSRALRYSLSFSIQKLNESYRISLGKTFSLFDKRISLAMDTALIVLILSLVVAMVTAILITRTLIRPISALKDGTEKISLGQYETIPITSSDEIADLTREFNQMSEKLKQLDEMRVQLMSEISHEMRSPLQVIKAGCHMISHTKEAPPLIPRQVEAVALINQAANRINRFVNSFLDIVKIESGLMKFFFIPTDILELVTPLVQEAQLIGQSRQIGVEFLHDKFKPMALDREKLVQVVSNLISNAMKYTPTGGKITIRLLQTYEMMGNNANKEFARIDVQDTGVGIPPEDLEKLFTKFFQASNKAVVNEKGSGLGLALVKHVAEAHGGRVSVSSKVGQGSTFSVFLPTDLQPTPIETVADGE